MIPAFLTKVFGPNWRTSLGGITETLMGVILIVCVLPADVWQKPTVWIPASLLALAKTWKDIHTRDRGVTSVAMGLQEVEKKSTATQVVTPVNK